MAPLMKYSTLAKNFLQLYGSKKLALINGVFEIFDGTEPTSADDPEIGTKCVKITNNSATHTPEVLSFGTLTLTGGASGSVNTLTVNSVEVMGVAVPFNVDLATTAADVAAQINSYLSSPDYQATSSGAVITLKALPNTGVTPNTYVVAATYTTITGTPAAFSGGVAPVNGLQYGAVTAGKLVRSGVWSGVVTAGGTAKYFRFKGSILDAGTGSGTLFIRLQGTCGTSGANYKMGDTTLILGTTHTIGTFEETL